MSASDFGKLQEILDNQQKEEIKSEDWKDVKGYTITTEEGYILLSIKSNQVGFAFNEHGQFAGIYNWKD